MEMKLLRACRSVLAGRYLCADLVDKDGNVLVKANHMVTPKRAELIMNYVWMRRVRLLQRLRSVRFFLSFTHRNLCKMLWCEHGDGRAGSGW